MNLYRSFLQCLRTPYSQTENGINYASRRDGNVLHLFFEASDGEADWKRNLNFPAKAYKRMGRTVWFAHRGFLSAWKEVEPFLAADISNSTIRSIHIIGYSHGAAIALLCHEYVWYQRPDLRDAMEGCGFGCPRVFWGPRSHELLRRWERFSVIRNVDDVVTHLPPALLGYSHVGQLITIGERGKYSPIDAHRPENILRELRIYENKRTET